MLLETRSHHNTTVGVEYIITSLVNTTAEFLSFPQCSDLRTLSQRNWYFTKSKIDLLTRPVEDGAHAHRQETVAKREVVVLRTRIVGRQKAVADREPRRVCSSVGLFEEEVWEWIA